MLRAVTTSFESSFVIIDALDECSPATRLELTRTLRSIEPSISLLITSRYLGDIRDSLEDVSKVEVLAPEQDFKSYAQGCIERYPSLKSYFETSSDDTKSRYLWRILKCAAGMFVTFLSPNNVHR